MTKTEITKGTKFQRNDGGNVVYTIMDAPNSKGEVQVMADVGGLFKMPTIMMLDYILSEYVTILN